MPTTSSIPAVTDALLDTLRAATWQGDVPEILDSDVTRLDRDNVIVGDTFDQGDDEQGWMTFAKARVETYALGLTVYVSAPGRTVKEARDRAFQILATIETALADDPTLGGLVLMAQLRQPTHQQGTNAEGWGCRIDSALRVQARITPAGI